MSTAFFQVGKFDLVFTVTCKLDYFSLISILCSEFRDVIVN